MAACPVEPLLAVGYETGDVELWDLGLMARIQRVPGGSVEVTALAWARDSLDGSWRTFCACLNGTLTEVDWRRTQMVAPTESGAGAIWSLSAQPVSSVRPGFAHPLAAGCDDGSVRLFVVEAGEGGAHYERTLARLQGRVLAVAWHPSGLALVAGGADGCIHALDAATGKLLRSNHDAPATSLAFSPDAQQLAVTLASGQLEVYDVAGRQPTPWSLEQAEGVAACLQRLPGVPMGCSWDPSPQAPLSSNGPTPALPSLPQGAGGAGEAGR
ncbi:WD_REPEATS_REGION domain-containing protein, partial [Haematococcus lacustris]